MKLSICFFSSLFLISALTGCFYDNKEDLFQIDEGCDTLNVTYSLVVQPIIQNRCYTCHATGNNLGGGHDLESFTSLQNYVNNNKLLLSVNHEPGASVMPPGGQQIPQCEIDKIERWVANGAKND